MKKEVTLYLSACIQDPKGKGNVRLEGVKLSGTPLQVGMIFEILNGLPGQPDIFNGEGLKILHQCEDALKKAREAPLNSDGSFDYIDPNKVE